MTEKLYSHDLIANILVDKQEQFFVQKNKIVFGPDGSYTDVTSNNPFPVIDSGSINVLNDISNELVAFHGDNTVENLDIISAITGFQAENTLENNATYNAITGFQASNTSENDSINSVLTEINNKLSTDFSDISDNRTFCFAIDTLNMATAANNNPLILIDNPSSSTKSIYIKNINAATSINNVYCIFNIYGNPTVTSAGTAQTIRNRTIGSAITSVATLTTLPTVSSSGQIRSSFFNAQNSNSLPIIDYDQLKIPPGNKLLLTGNPQSNNRNAVITLVWSEI